MGSLIKRFFILMWGLLLMSIGTAMSFQSYMGLSPWDILNHGIANITGLDVGKANILCGIAILLIVVLLKEKVGFGTFINILTIGTILDIIINLNIIPSFAAAEGFEHIVPRTLMCLFSMFFMSFGMYFYMSTLLGAGPRDSLMVLVTRRTNLNVVWVRVIIEGIAFVTGWLLGGTIGIGSVILVLLSGPIMGFVFKLMKFDVKTIQNQTVFDTINEIKSLKTK